MDLNNFIKKEKTEKLEKEFEDENVIVKSSSSKKSFYFKNVKGAYKYQNDTFLNLSFGKVLNNLDEVKDFLKKATEDEVEGVMLKDLNSIYKSGIRTKTMYKLKDTIEDLDLVIIGAEMGKGKRAGFFSSFFIACKNEDSIDESDKFLTIGKVASGIRELGDDGVSMKNLTKLLEPLKTNIDEKNQIIYFKPKIIVQIRYQQIQRSEIYNSKIALRFPRLIDIRYDKSLDEINSIKQITDLM